MKAAPIIAAAAVRKIGLKRTAPASISAARKLMPPARKCRMKSTSRIELRTTMPASAMKPIIEVAVKAALNNEMAEHDADERQRHRRQDDQRQLERAELRDDEKIDAEQRHHEGGAHVAEGDIGHLPLAVPEQRGLGIIERLAVIFDRRRTAAPQSIFSIASSTASMP